MGSEKKAKERARRIKKDTNMKRNNTCKSRFMLQIKQGLKWVPAMPLRDRKAIEGYVASIEDIRMRDASDIVEGQVVDTITGRVIVTIPEHKQGSKTV